jgi:hypothetical protein
VPAFRVALQEALHTDYASAITIIERDSERVRGARPA